MQKDCSGCEQGDYPRREFDARFRNSEGYKIRTIQDGMNHRNMTSDELVKYGFRGEERRLAPRKIGGPSPYDDLHR